MSQNDVGYLIELNKLVNHIKKQSRIAIKKEKEKRIEAFKELEKAIDIIQYEKGNRYQKPEYCTIIHLLYDWKDFKKKYGVIIRNKKNKE